MTTRSTIGQRPAKNALFDGFAAVAGAMANGRRVEIIELLAQGERSVEHIADSIDQSVANTSHHLRRLARVGLVKTRRDRTRIHYRLTAESVYDLWAALRDVTTRYLDDIARLADAYLGDRTEITIITRGELQERLQRDQAIPYRRTAPNRIQCRTHSRGHPDPTRPTRRSAHQLAGRSGDRRLLPWPLLRVC